MRRKVYQGFKGLGLTLAGCALVVAILSSRYGVIWVIHDRQIWIELDVGAVLIGWVSRSTAFAPTAIELLRHDGWYWAGWLPRIECSPTGTGIVSLPVWLLSMPLFIPIVIRTFRRRQRPPIECMTCGYNLTGNVSGICPECGTAIVIPPSLPKCRRSTSARSTRSEAALRA